MTNALFKGRSKTLMIILNIIGLAAAVLLILKVPFGYGTTDECYYLVSPLKVLGGDAMLKDEWFIAQLSGFILMPVLKLYLLIAGSTEGILLSFRYIFVAVKILAAVFIYRRLKRSGNIFPAFLASLLFLIYTPYDILGFSYNTIGHICMCMSMAIMATLDLNERAYAILAGILYAAAVLCCPYLAVLYVIYTIFILCTRSAEFAKSTGALKTGTWVRLSIGVLALAVSFIVFLLLRATPSQIIESIPHVLFDPAHPRTEIFTGIKSFIHTVIMWDMKRLLIFALLAAICAVMLFVKKLRRFRVFFFAAAAILTLLYVFLPGYMFDMANHYILPLNILGFVCFFLTDRKDHRMFWGMWIPGLIYAIVIYFSSNQGFYMISSATIVSAPASILFILEAAADIAADLPFPANAGSAATGALALLLIAFQISAVTASAWEHCCWDENRSSLDTVIEEGCEKGIITTQTTRDDYMDLRAETADFRNMTGTRVLYYTEYELWLVLDDAKQVGSCFSYYFGDEDYLCGELKEYYDMYPDKRPGCMYFEKATDINIAADILGLDKDLIKTTAGGNYLYVDR